MLTVLCRHCNRPRTGNRPRGLCWTCYYTPSVRDHYPPRADRVPVKNPSPPALADGVLLRPGSEEKIEYLGRKAVRGESLFHPDEREWLRRRAILGLPPFQLESDS